MPSLLADMVFRDLAQGAFRMRGIGEGQTITILIIPEVTELMQRQLTKAGYQNGQTAGHEKGPQATLLQDIAAWLVVNSMRTETLQFDQLCQQNLANIWRENAFEQLLNGHRRFTVRPNAANAFVLNMLGEAFVSNREGSVSRSKTEGKVLALYFRTGPSAMPCDNALRTVYSKFHGGSGLAFEVIQLDDGCNTVETFTANFREMPWLAIPFAHVQRRAALRKLFEVKDGEQVIVLLNQEGQTITREGVSLLELAHSCEKTLEKKAKAVKSIDVDKKMLLQEREKLATQMAELQPICAKVANVRNKLAGLRAAELREINEFISEPASGKESQEAVAAAEEELADARRAVQGLSTANLEHMRSTEAPSPALKAAVEAMCVMLETKPDFALAQSRLMRTSQGLVRRVVTYDHAQVPRSASSRLQRFIDSSPDVCEEPVAKALHQWVTATIALDQAAADAKLAAMDTECSPALVSACECVCDLFGLQGQDDDLRGALQLAAAFPADDGRDDEDGEAQGLEQPSAVAQDARVSAREALEQKLYRLKQFKELLHVELTSTIHSAQSSLDQLKSLQPLLNDRNGFSALLSGGPGGRKDPVFEVALTLMLRLLFPDWLAKMDGGESNAYLIASEVIKPNERGTFDKFIEGMRGLEAQITDGQLQVEDYASVRALTQQLEERMKGHRFRQGGELPTVFSKYLIEMVAYYGHSAQLAGKRPQLEQVKQELAVAQKQADEEVDGEEQRGGVSALALKSVQEAVQKHGGVAQAVWVRWALKRTAGNEAAATALILARPAALKVVRALQQPGDALFASASELSAITTARVRSVRLTLRKDGIRRIVEAYGEETDDEAEEGTGEQLPDASRSELLLLRWANAVCNYMEAEARTQPQQQKVILLERKVEEKQRMLEAHLRSHHQDAMKKAASLELPIELFPLLTPYQHFPWEKHFLPRSDAEDGLRTAIGLRDLPMLVERLPHAESVGLSKRNSRVYFEAVELRDLLAADETIAASMARDDDDDSIDVNEPRSPLRGYSDSEMNLPPPITREKTQDAMDRLGSALDVFVEDVCTAVPSTLPKPKRYVDILSDRAEHFKAFVKYSGVAQRDAILATVSGAVGVSDIETEQCREQEQEKSQEQEQEQEIEMERYVDVAYQRDNEEPQRWAFCMLGEHAESQQEAPFASGVFYPASNFRLHGRSPLPFPPCLSVSRNHFNLDWVGERRLKNAVCVLEWVPSVAQLRRTPSLQPQLSTEQSGRVDDALKLLNLRGDWRYGRREIAQLMRAAEHEAVDDAAVDQLLDGAHEESLSFDEMRRVLVSGELRRGDCGRHFVLLSLAEAETIRCILHMRQGQPLLPGSDMALALRCITANDAVFDATASFPAATEYQRRVSQQTFRFLDSAMHYKPAELNVLLRSLPAPPAARRLFFSTVVACRRRLAKRWEQTPLAKIFALPDEWAMLKLEALRLRIGDAITKSGFLLHDAFLKFDADDDGLLSLAEVRSALQSLGLTLSHHDVITFVRSISSEPHVSYGAFVELLTQPELETEEADTLASPLPSLEVPFMLISPQADVAASKELRELWAQHVREERTLAEKLEAEIEEQAERSRRFVEAQLLDSDFSWMRETRRQGGRNPRTTRTSCFYDCTAGELGSQKGAPLWMEGCGRWMNVRQGSASVACVKAYEGTFFVLRVPFRKSGTGHFCNTYTVSMMVRMSHVAARGVMSTGGWDQWNQLGDGDEESQIVMNDRGVLGAHDSFAGDGGNGGGAHLEAAKWCACTFTVDTLNGIIRTFVNGEESAVVRSPKICRDGQHALKGRLALFFGRQGRPSEERTYLRQVTIHNRVLEAAQVTKEHEMFHELLIEDALQAVPAYLQPSLSVEHAAVPFKQARDVRTRVRAIRQAASSKAQEMWRALLLPASAEEIEKLLAKMQPHDLAVAARWSCQEGTLDEASPPSGETLLHCAAHAGCEGVVAALLEAGARPSARGTLSGCTPLHAAAGHGHAAVCQQLLAAGARVAVPSASSKRTALDLAGLGGHTRVARLLVEAGADPYVCALGSETTMAVLRRLGSAGALALLGELDALCGSRAQGDTAEAAAPVVESEAIPEQDDVEHDASDSEDDEGLACDREDNDDELEELEEEE